MGKSKSNRKPKPKRVGSLIKSIVYRHGNLLAHVQGAEISTKIERVLSNLKMNDENKIEEEISVGSKVLVAITLDGGRKFRRAAIDITNPISVDATDLDNDEYYSNVELEDVYSIKNLKHKELIDAPAARPFYIHGFHDKGMMVNPKQLGKLLEAVNNMPWNVQKTDEKHHIDGTLHIAKFTTLDGTKTFGDLFEIDFIPKEVSVMPPLIIDPVEKVRVCAQQQERVLGIQLSSLPASELRRLEILITNLTSHKGLKICEAGGLTRENDLVAAFYDGRMVRGYVLEVHLNGAEVYLMDYGVVEKCRFQRLRVLTKEFIHKIPRYGVRVYLPEKPMDYFDDCLIEMSFGAPIDDIVLNGSIKQIVEEFPRKPFEDSNTGEVEDVPQTKLDEIICVESVSGADGAPLPPVPEENSAIFEEVVSRIVHTDEKHDAIRGGSPSQGVDESSMEQEHSKESENESSTAPVALGVGVQGEEKHSHSGPQSLTSPEEASGEAPEELPTPDNRPEELPAQESRPEELPAPDCQPVATSADVEERNIFDDSEAPNLTPRNGSPLPGDQVDAELDAVSADMTGSEETAEITVCGNEEGRSSLEAIPEFASSSDGMRVISGVCSGSAAAEISAENPPDVLTPEVALVCVPVEEVPVDSEDSKKANHGVLLEVEDRFRENGSGDTKCDEHIVVVSTNCTSAGDSDRNKEHEHQEDDGLPEAGESPTPREKQGTNASDEGSGEEIAQVSTLTPKTTEVADPGPAVETYVPRTVSPEENEVPAILDLPEICGSEPQTPENLQQSEIETTCDSLKSPIDPQPENIVPENPSIESAEETSMDVRASDPSRVREAQEPNVPEKSMTPQGSGTVVDANVEPGEDTAQAFGISSPSSCSDPVLIVQGREFPMPSESTQPKTHEKDRRPQGIATVPGEIEDSTSAPVVGVEAPHGGGSGIVRATLTTGDRKPVSAVLSSRAPHKPATAASNTMIGYQRSAMTYGASTTPIENASMTGTHGDFVAGQFDDAEDAFEVGDQGQAHVEKAVEVSSDDVVTAQTNKTTEVIEEDWYKTSEGTRGDHCETTEATHENNCETSEGESSTADSAFLLEKTEKGDFVNIAVDNDIIAAEEAGLECGENQEKNVKNDCCVEDIRDIPIVSESDVIKEENRGTNAANAPYGAKSKRASVADGSNSKNSGNDHVESDETYKKALSGFVRKHCEYPKLSFDTRKLLRARVTRIVDQRHLVMTSDLILSSVEDKLNHSGYAPEVEKSGKVGRIVCVLLDDHYRRACVLKIRPVGEATTDHFVYLLDYLECVVVRTVYKCPPPVGAIHRALLFVETIGTQITDEAWIGNTCGLLIDWCEGHMIHGLVMHLPDTQEVATQESIFTSSSE